MPQVSPQQTLARIMERIHEQVPELDADRSERLGRQIEALVHQQVDEESARDREVTILLSDIRGFTALSERYEAGQVVGMLNHYFERMNQIIYDHGGLIDKYMGDSIMVLFGARETRPDDAHRAVDCAVQMQIAMDQVNQGNARLGLPNLFMGIGINTGRVSTGEVGSDLHREFTVIGDGVNVASRIESHSLRGQVLVSENTHSRIADTVEVGDRSETQVKGKSEPIGFYEVVACNWQQRIEVPRREIRSSPRVDVKVPFSYNELDGKIVLSEQHNAKMLDLSYHGLFAVTSDEVEPLCDIKLSVSLSLLGGEMRDIYAKVMSVRRTSEGYGLGIEFTALDTESQLALRDFVDRILESK